MSSSVSFGERMPKREMSEEQSVKSERPDCRSFCRSAAKGELKLLLLLVTAQRAYLNSRIVWRVRFRDFGC